MTFQTWYLQADWLHLTTAQTAILGGFVFFIAILIAFAITEFFRRF